jgi:hypothetical protein
MAARLWTTLLVLAGVFVMHGVQCTVAADDLAHASSAVHPAASAPGLLTHSAGEVTGTLTAATPDVAGPGTAPAATAPAHPASASHEATAVTGSSPTAPHGAADHLWTVCLAVLAAALAALLAVLLPHPGLVTRLALTRVRTRLRSLTPARPPDLAELCLLRI